MRYLVVCLIAFTIFSCKDESKAKVQEENILKNGMYRAVFEVQDNEKLPFIFEVKSPT